MTPSLNARFREASAVLLLAAPIMVSQVLQISATVIDTLMAGRASATELAGVAVGSSLWIPVFLFMIGAQSSLTPVVAQLVGANRYQDIARPVYQAFWQILIYLPPVVVLAFYIEPLFRLMQVDEKILPIASGYFQALIWGLPGLMGFNILRCYSDGLSLTKPAMLASLVGLIVNAPMNYVLIFGKFGFPALGGVGCGWASTLSFWVMFLFMLGYTGWHKFYRLAPLYLRTYGLYMPDLTNLFRIGIPIGLAFLVESSMFSLIALFLSSKGPIIVAAHQIVLNVASLLFMVPLSIGLALTIRIGQRLGAQQPEMAKITASTGLVLALGISLVSASVLVLFNESIAWLYNDQIPVIELAAQLMLIAALFQLADATQVTAACILRGYKDTRVPMFITVAAYWLVAIPVGLYLSNIGINGQPLNAHGYWYALLVGLSFAALLLYQRYRRVSDQAILEASLV